MFCKSVSLIWTELNYAIRARDEGDCAHMTTHSNGANLN